MFYDFLFLWELFIDYCSTSPIDIDDMAQVPYASAIGSLMYVVVYTGLSITQAISFIKFVMANLG